VQAGSGTVFRPADLPRPLGKFQLLELVGRGSFGSVYKARDAQLDRVVAIKVPCTGYFATPEDEQRFLRESRSAAQLVHPHIVQIHDIAYEGAMPYLVCDFIEGRTLAEQLAEQRPSFRESAELAAQVADALHYAHRRQVIHRDVNPRNILINGAGRPHVADFGLARRDEGSIAVTVVGQVLGTPAYMAPEQAAGEQSKVDGRTDVYSLGVILYELLTEERPFRGSMRMLLHQVIRDEPRSPRRLNDRIPRDLQTICLKAMAKSPARRYQTAAEMAADLRRYLNAEPIQARPVGDAERLWRWCRRNPLVAGLTAAVAGLLIAVAIGASVAPVQLGRSAEKEHRARADAERNAEQERSARADAERNLEEMQESLSGLRAAQGVLLSEETNHRKLPHLDRVWCVAFHADKKWLATGAADGGVRLWDIGTGNLLATHWQFLRDRPDIPLLAASTAGLMGSPLGQGPLLAVSALFPERTARPLDILSVAFSPDGKLLATCGGYDIQFLETATWQPWGMPLPSDSVRALTFSPDGKLLAAGDGHTAGLWEVATRKPHPVRPLQHKSTVSAVAFSPKGRRLLATGSADRTAKLWDLDTGEQYTLPPEGAVEAVAFSPDGSLLATACRDLTVRLWESATGQPPGRPFQHQALVQALAFSPDGKRLATASDDGTARLWDSETGLLCGPVLRHEFFATAVAFSPDGQWLATASCDKTARLWPLPAMVTDLEEMRLRTWVALGARDTGQGVQPILWQEWQKLRDKLRAREARRGAPRD
jgi:hypothetical protein